MNVTIKDVAARAGVSPKTVSRVMNEEPYVRDRVRETVLKVVAELGYRPNSFARSLSSSRSYLFALVFDDPSSGYATGLQKGAARRCREKSYHLVVEQVDVSEASWAATLTASILSLRLDGVILAPPLCENTALLDLLEMNEVPYVRISPGTKTPNRSGSVSIDERRAAFDMTRYLIGLGHSDIAFVKGDPTHASAHMRLQGYLDAVASAGLSTPPDFIQAGDFSFRAGLEAGERLFSLHRSPSAVFAANDDMALGVFAASMKAGLTVPDHVSLAGFDDAPTARMAWPAITTVRQPVMDIGAAAVDMLIQPNYREAYDSDDFRRCLDYELMERGSTSLPARLAKTC